MFELVCLKVRSLVNFEYPVFSHGACSHQLAPRVVILAAGKQNSRISDNAAHYRFIDIIGKIVLRLAEVRFHSVSESVERFREHLFKLHRHRMCQVEEREIRLRSEKPALDLLRFIGDYRALVHLRTCSLNRNYRTHRNRFGRKFLLGDRVFLYVLVCFCLCGNDLAAVDNRATVSQHNCAVIFQQTAEVFLNATFA